MGANASYPERPSASGHQRVCAHITNRYSQSHAFCMSDPENVTSSSKEKKKKSSKLATLRKKLSRARRHSRSFDHGKALRDFTASWTIRELNALVEEYEASSTLKELSIHANLARPHGNTFKEDLCQLYDSKCCTDVDLIYHGSCFPVHRVILSVRCPFFRELLKKFPQYGAQIPVMIRTPGVDVHMFSALIQYLYTGEFNATESKLENVDVLVQLGEEFGVPNPLEHDMRNLLETGRYSDAVIVFSPEADYHDPLYPEGAEGQVIYKNELRCHKAILAARSPFFRNLLLRRARLDEEHPKQTHYSPTCIVLDESVIPRQYARVLLHAIYLDYVELSQIVHSSVSMCSLSEVQAMVAGKGNMTQTDEAMEIYQIGQFLDFPVLSQGCEDIIVDSLTIDNLVSILNWSLEPHGSKWVHRQALNFLREEFLQIAHSSVLFELSKEHLLQAVKSDFLQSGELDVLIAVLKWGENQLMKRMEEREPNLLSHTAHSVSKKGIKKRDLNDIELRDILADVLPFIRTDHIIPPNCDSLTHAIKRGLISTPPSHMIRDEGSMGRVGAWVRSKNAGMFVKPRLFTPYADEAKTMLDEQVSQVQENEVVRLRMIHMSAIPDTLYMVEDPTLGSSHAPCMPSSFSTVDILSGSIPVPDEDTLKALLQREHELQHTKHAQRGYSLPCLDRRDVTHEIQLRVVREFGLPDSTVEILQNTHMYNAEESPPVVNEARYLTPSRQRDHLLHHHHHHHYLHHHHHHSVPSRHRDIRGEKSSPSMPVTPVRTYSPVEKEPSVCSDSILSDMMPDIAMATASLNQMNMQDVDLAHPDLELDLGDGNNHSGNGTLYI